jgi:hypothetical protein
MPRMRHLPRSAGATTLINHQQTRPTISADAAPHPGCDQVNRYRSQLLLQPLDVEHYQRTIQLDIARPGEEARAKGPVNVAPEPCRETGRQFARHVREDAMEILEDRRLSGVCGNLTRDARRGICPVHRTVQQRPFRIVQRFRTDRS